MSAVVSLLLETGLSVIEERVLELASKTRGMLMELGLDKPGEREAAIGHVKGEHPGLLENDDRAFYVKVLVAVKKDPSRWRAVG